jgi:hypothetical protein
MLKAEKVISRNNSRALVSWKQSYNNTNLGWVEQLERHCVPSYTIQQLEKHCVPSSTLE